MRSTETENNQRNRRRHQNIDKFEQHKKINREWVEATSTKTLYYEIKCRDTANQIHEADKSLYGNGISPHNEDDDLLNIYDKAVFYTTYTCTCMTMVT